MPPNNASCRKIAAYAGDKKVLTLTYATTLTLPTLQAKLEPTETSAFYVRELGSFLSDLSATLGPPLVPQATCVPTNPECTAPVAAAGGGAQDLTVLQRALRALTVRSGTTVVGDGTVQTPEGGQRYVLPIQKPKLFGKETLAAAFAESGALTSIQYTSSSGSAAAIGVARDAFDTFHQTAAERAADLKAQADELAQRQRLVLCQADPTSCK